MALVLDNETYTRWIVDPEETELVFLVDGKPVDEDDLPKLAEKAQKDGKELDLTLEKRPLPDAKHINVTFKPLRAKDISKIEDSLQMEYGDVSAKVSLGSMRRLQVLAAVVKWDTTPAWTDNVCDNLHPDAFQAIFGWTSRGAVPPEQDEETGQPIPPTPPNRAQRRAASKTTKTPPVTAAAS